MKSQTMLWKLQNRQKLGESLNLQNSFLIQWVFTVRYNSQQSQLLAAHSATSHFLVGSDISNQGVICVSHLIYVNNYQEIWILVINYQCIIVNNVLIQNKCLLICTTVLQSTSYINDDKSAIQLQLVSQQLAMYVCDDTLSHNQLWENLSTPVLYHFLLS